MRQKQEQEKHKDKVLHLFYKHIFALYFYLFDFIGSILVLCYDWVTPNFNLFLNSFFSFFYYILLKGLISFCFLRWADFDSEIFW